MKVTVSKLLLLGCVLGGAANPAAGQTGRIAHLSHGGSTTILANGKEDNFGIVPKPTSQWTADTLTYLSNLVAIHSGSFRTYDLEGQPNSGWHRHVEKINYEGNKKLIPWYDGLISPLDVLHRLYPTTVFIGFDKLKKPVRKKSSGQIQAFPKRPFQYSYWRELAGAAALGAVGWLLGRKPGPKVG